MGVTPRIYSTPRVSPDGTQLAFRVFDGEDDIWTYHVGRQTSQRLTSNPAEDGDPVWTADGTKVAFFSTGRDGGPGVFWKAADGTGNAERLSTGAHRPDSVSPDGTRLLFADTGSGLDIGWLVLDGDPNPEPLYSSSFNEGGAVVSPDGQWMAYEADDSGRFEVYVRPFPNVDDGRWPISAAGGAEPVWGPAGQELFYRTGSEVVAVLVGEGTPSTWSSPIALFADQYVLSFSLSQLFGPGRVRYSRYYDVAPDGRFLMIVVTPVGDLVFVEHWAEELNRLVPTN